MAAPIANCPLTNASRTIVKAKFGKLKKTNLTFWKEANMAT